MQNNGLLGSFEMFWAVIVHTVRLQGSVLKDTSSLSRLSLDASNGQDSSCSPGFWGRCCVSCLRPAARCEMQRYSRINISIDVSI